MSAWVVGVCVLVLWALLLVAGLLRHRRMLLNLWREPVLRVPVLAFESDDWSPHPQLQAGPLRALKEVLARHRDADGNPGLMTLGLVLNSPQPDATGAVQWVDWSDPQVAPTRSAAPLAARMDAAKRKGASGGIRNSNGNRRRRYQMRSTALR